MAWRPAYSLQTLKDQLDTAYPGWLFLGFLGDQAHAAVASDHNPNSAGVVCALDIGPGGGLDIHGLANNIVASPQPDLKYIISNRRIAEWQYGFKWRPYGGSDPHDTHIHVSVGRGDDGHSSQPYDDRVQWSIGKQGDEMVEDKEHLDALFLRFRNRYPTADEYSKFVGKESYKNLIVVLNQGPEADNLSNAVKIGTLAIRDNWEQQIKDWREKYEKGVVTKGAVLDYLGKNLG